MKIGISSGSYFGLKNYREGLLLMKKHGYDCVDFQAFANTENALYQSGSEELLKEIKAAAESAGIEISQTHGPWRWPVHDFTEEERAERYEKMSRALYGTALLGCPYCVIHPIMPFGTDSDPEPEKMFEMNLEYYGRLEKEARKSGTVICLENMPMVGLKMSPPDKTMELVRALDSDYVRFCLDTGHCTMFGQPADGVRVAGKEYLKTLHIHDNDGKRDLHLVPFTGVIDWTAFAEALKEIGYDGVVSLETAVKGDFPPELLEEQRIGLAHMARWLADHAAR